MNKNLDLKLHNENFASIADLSDDLDISFSKWAPLFTSTFKLYNNIYFSGAGLWVNDSEFDNIIGHLSEEIFFINKKKHSRILFRFKISSLMGNSNLLTKLWGYYEYPCFVFLENKIHENTLVESLKIRIFINTICSNVENVLFIYREAELNVLWMKGNVDVKRILFLAGYLNI